MTRQSSTDLGRIEQTGNGLVKEMLLTATTSQQQERAAWTQPLCCWKPDRESFSIVSSTDAELKKQASLESNAAVSCMQTMS